MAITTAELSKVYVSRATGILRNALSITNGCNRDYQAALRAAYEVEVPTGEVVTGAPADRARNASWGADEAADYTLTPFRIDKEKMIGTKIDWRNQREAPFNVVARIGERHGYLIAKAVEDDIAAAIVSGAKAGNIDKVGVAAHYIDEDGDATGDEADDFVYDLLDKFSTVAAAAAVSSEAAAMQRELNCWMSPALFRSLRRKLIATDSLALLAAEAFREGNRIGMPPAGFSGRIFGINVHQSNLVPSAEVSNKTHAQLIVSTQEATTFASGMPVVQTLTPQTNQDGPQFALRQTRPWGRKVMDNDQLWIGRVRQEA